MQAKSAILGFGTSGRSAAAFLLRQGHSILVLDKNWEVFCKEGNLQDIAFQSDDPSHLEGVDQLILSPGIPFSHPVVQEAKRLQIPVIGEVELGFRYLQNRCIGVTGSNGKTTTTLCITHALNALQIPARALGNVGVGLTSYLLNPDPREILVIELSSFQIEALETPRLEIGLLLNIFENHLDRYGSMEAYAKAKMHLQQVLLPGGVFWVSQDVARSYGGLCPESHVFLNEIGGDSNFSAAWAVLKTLGISKEAFIKTLETFSLPSHRREKVAEIDGVVYYNDSKASNVISVIYAMQRMEKPVVLIVGGTDKGSCYTPWIDAFRGKVKHIFAYGLAKDKIESELNGAFPLTKVGPFAEAVEGARRISKRGDAVLLSPGCSSYDQFRNFEHRGEVFKQMVMAWIEKKSS